MTASIESANYLESYHRPAGRIANRAAPRQTTSKDRELSDLMRSAQDGDRVAYVALLEKIEPILKRIVHGRLAFLPAADREDLVQDIFLSLHSARATYDPERPFMPWLVSIAHNRMVDSARRNSRRFANEVLVDELPTTVADDDAVSPGNAYRDPDALRQAVKNLPQGQRKAIELLKLHEMSLKEAAKVSGMTVSALKVSAHRAIKALRVSLHA